ncbi:MAG: adenosylmethionine--8-amino-7-oxononanoate transaminase [Chitinophagales bacterium]|nr:adenosylmethionine--8-amino-7-oxononanoate transaminase [Chitinophagales bacterium]MDW8419347.1 adenosylmethionine--8-amino-7-oxononanoate transaminase [Chitinophagales bacterium]
MASYPIWHPYTQMQTAGMPVKITRGERELLYDENGNTYIDAISSWWVNLHGHAHPVIARAIYEQALKLEQVIFAGFTHEPAVDYANMLLRHIPFHQKVFYTDNGSTAVEVALKMALQYWKNKGLNKTKIICFRDAYHGDTFGSMSVSARGVFTNPYQELLFEVCFIDTPTAKNTPAVMEQLRGHLQRGNVAAFIFEPLVLGSAGMLMYPPEVLDEMIRLTRESEALSIADEVFTGFGRTGKFLATDYCMHRPDIVCLSKGITGGFIPFAVTTCTLQVYEAFLSHEKTKMLFHGHSYSGNPLGCAAAIASLRLFEEENTLEKIAAIMEAHRQFATRINSMHGVAEVRQTGTILAIELENKHGKGYLNPIGERLRNYALSKGVLLRPLGNVAYVLPPYCIAPHNLQRVYDCITGFLQSES